MALEDEQIETLCRKYGEFLFHDTTAVKTILKLKTGLRPATEGDRGWAPVLRPRPNCVYFRLPVEELVSGLKPEDVERYPFRVKLHSIDVKRFLVEEDTVRDWIRGFGPEELPPFGSEFESMPDELVSEGCMGRIGPTEITRPVVLSRGEWVERVDQDTPENTWASAMRGALAVRDPIDRALVEVNLASSSIRKAIRPKWIPL